MNQPRLRFKEFKGEWEKEPFLFLLNGDDGIRRGPFGSSIKKSDFIKDGPYVVYEQQNAIYNRFDTRYRISQKKYSELSKFHLQSDDFIMSGAGTIGKISRVPLNVENGVFNQALIRMRIKFSTDSNYFLQFMRSNLMQKKLKENNPGSAMQNLRAMKEIKNIKINFPNYPEQQKIGQFFQNLDQQIELQSDKLEHLKQSKQGYLQKMFADRNSKLPILRFNGFKDTWNSYKIDDIFIVKRGNVLARNKINNKRNNVDKYPVYSSQTQKNGLLGFYNNYLYEDAITWTTDGANAGTVLFRSGKFYSTNVNGVLISENGYANKAVANILNNIAFKYVSRVGNPKLMNNTMKDIVIKIPKVQEQLKISNFINYLDRLIDLQQQKVDHLKRQKQAYLQKMFV